MASEFAVGQQVKLWCGWYRSTRDATITKVGRVWCEVTPDGLSAPVRIHMQRRDEGDGVNDGYRLYTLDEWAEHDQQIQDAKFLRGQGILLDRDSIWTVTTLASLIRGAVEK